VDLESVRVHTDSTSQDAARHLSARAFAFGPHIVVGRGERPTDLGLMAHEAAHVVQQQAAPAVQRFTSGTANSFEREAHQASTAVVTGVPFQVRERTTAPQLQRLGISDALNYFADKANLIPGFRMFTIVLGVNPINMSPVPRNAANVLRAIVELIPFGGVITQALDNYGIFDKIGSWVDQQLSTLGMTGAAIKQAVSQFLDSLSFSDIFNLGGVWERAKRIFTEPIDRIINFAKGLVTGIVNFIKDAILMPLAKLAEGTRGWDLLIAVLGKNPITGEAVPRTAETLIGGFMKLIGQEEIWENIKKANALSRAWAWFQSALSGLLGFVQQIPSLFVSTLKSLEVTDIVLLPRAFMKVAGVFGSFIGNFLSWAGNAVWNLLQIIFEVVAPGAIPYLKKVGAAFKSILKNPIGFVGNLVKAGMLGFQNFASNILTHLKNAFIEWLTGSLTGVYLPKSLDLKEIVKFVLSVLGLTWANIRQKLVKVVGEPAVKAMEVGFDIVVTLVTQGPAAAWDKIKEQLSNLKDMVMNAIMDFVVETVVKKAIAKVVSLLVPGGAFIQAIISIYDTIMVFVDKLKKIIQVVMAFLDSMMAIASGAIGGAAAKIESTLAGLLVLAINFLAGFLGLGKIADKVMNIINTKVRQPIDKALDKVIDWIVTMAKKLGRFVAQAGLPNDPNERLKLGVDAALSAADRFAGKKVGKLVLSPLLAGIKVRYGFTVLDVEPRGDVWGITATINPTKKVNTHVKIGDGSEITEGGLKKMPVTEITFYVKTKGKGGRPGLDKVEFDRQLALQEQGINAMVIQVWIANRTKFELKGRESKGDADIKKLKASFEEQLKGKPLAPRPSNPDPDVQQLYSLMELAQTELQRMKIEVIKANPDLAKPENAAKLLQAVNDKFKSSAGLHRVDQIAGGSGRDIAGLGGEREDFSIGAAWAQNSKNYFSRVETVHQFILDKMDKLVYPTEKMNLKLTSVSR
jgi:hypothetical protein